jgi:aspartyl-tRNA(Asn)/glutamyl-tRNA(Gln) amidotransferase subunit B
MMTDSYETVIGLEVHIELKTESKIFCGCPTAFGAEPNTQCCPVCSGMPGALPVLNRRVVEYAIKAGLATGCAIAPYSKCDRKNYFYPDLPKAYQISQFDLPLCEHGHINIATETGEKRVGITRIHIEEDAGKLTHDDTLGTLIDLNRCGVPLIEVVSQPDMRSAGEAVAYLKKLRAIVLYCDISDAKMNEGSFRCDVNLSVRKKGEEALGTRAEIKNLNSFAFVAKAIEQETRRQIQALEAGEAIVQETRRFDAASGSTYSMRGKENADDYRYFPDPDLAPIVNAPEEIARIAAALPRLPDARKEAYMSRYGLSAYHSEMLTLDKTVSDFFEEAAEAARYPKQAATLIISELFRLRGADEGAIPIEAAAFAAAVNLAGDGQVNSGGAKKLLSALWESGGDPDALADSLNLRQLSDPAALKAAAETVLTENPPMAQDYRNGKAAAFKALMGLAMAKTKGRANPAMLQRLLEDELRKG